MAEVFSFTNTERNQNLTVQVVSDSFKEFNETFSATLESVFLAHATNGQALVLSDQEAARLVLNPDSASITILDDDGTLIFIHLSMKYHEL